jgi:hypothetical protein
MATDWTRVDATTDEEIARQIAEDPDTAPELTGEMLRDAYLVVNGVRIPFHEAPVVAPDGLPPDDQAPAPRTAAEG